MINKSVITSMLTLLVSLAGGIANAQPSYFQAVTNLNPVGYWPMHEATSPAVQGNIETNYGTLGIQGTGYYPDWINPSSTAIKRQAPGALAGDSDTAVYFAGAGASNRGSTTNSLYIPRTSPLTTLVPPFTVECWFYPTNSNQNDIWGQSGAAGLNNGANWGGMRLYWGPGFTLYSYDGQNGSTLRQIGSVPGANFPVGQWYHVVVTADANTNVSLYVNDALQFSAAAATLYSPDYWTPFQIGCSRGNSRAVAGIIDEFAIYTNDLSAASIETHYISATNGPVGQYKTDVLANNPVIYYRMNAPTYTIPTTASWNVMTNYGSSVGDGLYTPGTIPGVVAGPSRSGIPFAGLPVSAVPQLSGVSSFGVITNTASFNPTGPTPFTVSAMFRGNPMDVLHGNWETIIGHSDSSWRISMNVNGRLQSQLGTNGTSSVNSSVVNDGNWHHVVSVYTPGSTPTTTGTNALYIDGVLDAISTSVTTNGILPGSSLNVFVGSDPQFTNNPAGIGRQFHGQICEVALFGSTLSAAQVQGLYDAAGVAPAFKTQPVSASVNQNSSFTNATVVTGSQPITYRWYQGALLRSGQTGANLILNPVLGTDQGNYYLVASNAYGVVTSSVVSLTVFSAPSLSAPVNTNLTLFAGGKANLSVSATGAQPISYQWRSNNVDITSATNASFTFSNAPIGYAANIVCFVSNFVGTATTLPVSVSVIAAPTAPYPAKVLADNPRGYWRLNETDNNLGNGNAGATTYDYWGGDNGSYTNVGLGQSPYNNITDPSDTSAQFGLTGLSFVDSYVGNIQGADFTATNSSANFSVEAWVYGAGQSINGAGIVTKGYGNGGEQFCIDYQPAGIRFFVRDAAGGAHNCNSTISPDFGWHHVVGVCDEVNGLVSLYIDGRLAATATITPGSGIRSSTGPMTIGARKSASTSTSYNGQFYGEVDDVAVYGYALSAAQVQNHYTAAGAVPYFTQVPPVSVSLNEGATLILPGFSVGTPPLTNTWYDQSHGTNVTQTVSVTTNALAGSLIVSNVPPGWNGTSLLLTAANAFGSTNVTVSLTLVGGVPVFLRNIPPVVTTKVGKQYTYSVTVQGAEPFHYQWYSNNVPLVGQTASSFTFNATSANYHVVVTNIYGPSMSTVSALTTVPALTNAYATSLLALNPVGYWPLQEAVAAAPVTMETNLGTLGRLGNAFYAVTNADGGGVTGGTAQFGQGGALTSVGDNDPAVQFSGPSGVNFAFVPHASPSLSLRPPLTLEAWVNSSSTAFSDIMGQGHSGLNSAAGAGNGGGLRMSYGGNNVGGANLQLYIYDGNGVNRPSMGTPAGTLSYGVWHHCVATYDGTNASLYVDGVMQNTAPLVMNIDNWSPITIGDGFWSGGKGNRAYTGLIDEVAVYTNVLSATQIGNHWTAGSSSGNYKQSVLNDAPMLYYRMNSASYTTPDPLTFPTAVNYGSAPVNASYNPGVVPGALAGPIIVGISNSLATPINGVISGINADFDASFNPTGTQPFSVMTWFKSYPSDGVMQTLIGHGANWTLNLDGTTGKVVWNPGTAGSLTSTTVLNDNNWHLVAGVYNGSAISLYVDGALNGSAAAGSLTGDTVNRVWLGGNSAFTTVGNNEQFFAGALAHAAVFTNALSGAQIQQLFSMAAPPTLSLSVIGNQVVLTYTGTLVSSADVAGPYQPVVGATSPYIINTAAGAQRFYRCSNP